MTAGYPEFDADRFLALVEEAGVAPTRRSTRSWQFRCPACGSKGLKVYRQTGHFTCFGCRTVNGMHGGAELFLARVLNVPVGQARATLFGSGGAPLRTRIQRTAWTLEEDDLQELIPSVQWRWTDRTLDHPHAARGLRYLEDQRGVPFSLATAYGIRYSPEDRRVLFPITHDGRLIGWQGRLVVPDVVRDAAGRKHVGIKALTSLPSGVRDRVLMFQDRLVPGGHCVLGEGPVGALKAHLCGGNVATMGKVVSPAQLRILIQEGIRTLYLALDPDAAEEARRIVRKMASWMEIRQLEIPRGREDTGVMAPEEVYDCFRAARTLKPWTIMSWWGKGRKRATA